jgi:hypothetical protein
MGSVNSFLANHPPPNQITNDSAQNHGSESTPPISVAAPAPLPKPALVPMEA